MNNRCRRHEQPFVHVAGMTIAMTKPQFYLITLYDSTNPFFISKSIFCQTLYKHSSSKFHSKTFSSFLFDCDFLWFVCLKFNSNHLHEDISIKNGVEVRVARPQRPPTFAWTGQAIGHFNAVELQCNKNSILLCKRPSAIII